MFYFAISTIIAWLTFAPQEATVSDTLSWFPIGTYQSLHHTDFQSIRDENLYDDYPEFFQFKLFRKPLGYLPASLASDCTSITYIEEHRYQLDKEKKYLTIAGKETLGIFRFPDAEDAGVIAIEAGEMSPTGQTVLGREVYSFFTPMERKRCIAAVGAQEELLFAESVNTLERMILAGTGQALQMLDSEDYLDLPDQIPGDAQSWSVSFSVTQHNELLRSLRRSGADEELIKKKAEQYARGSRYFVTAYSLTEVFEERFIMVVGEEDIEEKIKSGERISSVAPINVSTPVKARYWGLREENTTETAIGSMIILTTAYDRELIKAEVELEREIEAEQAAKQAEKEKEDK